MLPAYPKPSQIRQQRPAVKVFAGGREVCDMTTKAGRDEYRNRVRIMWERQGKRCGLMISPQCKAKNGRLLINEATFEHSRSRGMGGSRRTDAIIDKEGKWLNMAACCWCNSLKSSRPLEEFTEIVP